MQRKISSEKGDFQMFLNDQNQFSMDDNAQASDLFQSSNSNYSFSDLLPIPSLLPFSDLPVMPNSPFPDPPTQPFIFYTPETIVDYVQEHPVVMAQSMGIPTASPLRKRGRPRKSETPEPKQSRSSSRKQTPESSDEECTISKQPLTQEEKAERRKARNREAAKRSRGRKLGEQKLLEVQNDLLQQLIRHLVQFGNGIMLDGIVARYLKSKGLFRAHANDLAELEIKDLPSFPAIITQDNYKGIPPNFFPPHVASYTLNELDRIFALQVPRETE